MDFLAKLNSLPPNQLNEVLSELNMTLDDLATYMKNYSEHLLNTNDSHMTYQIRMNLQTYIPPVFMFIGVIGNILSLCVFFKYSSKTPTYCYLTALAVLDILVLFFGQLRLWISHLISDDIEDINEIVCKLTAFLSYVFSDASAWIIVAVTLERYYAVCKPLTVRIYSKKLKWFTLGVMTIICLLNSHIFWTVELVVSKNISSVLVRSCQVSIEHAMVLTKIWPWIDSTVYSFAPSLLILYLNGRIIQELCKNSRERRLKELQKSALQNRKLTVLLLLVSFTFLLTTVPFGIFLIIIASLDEKLSTYSNLSDLMLGRTVAELLMYFNHSVNFLLYCIAGTQFRQHLYSLFFKSKKNKKLSYEAHRPKISVTELSALMK